MDKNKTYYETQSLPLAVTLICSGIPLDSVNKGADGKSTFVFPQSSDLSRIIRLFWQRALKVEPNFFWETQRFLKSRIYGE